MKSKHSTVLGASDMRKLIPLLLSATLVASVAADPNATFRFTGKVVTTDDQPVEGAVAEFYHLSQMPGAMEAAKKRVISDASGVIETELDLVPTLGLVRKAELAVTWFNLFNITGDHEERIVMTHATNLVGMVVDASDQPVGGAEVWVARAMVETVLDGNRRTYRSLFGTVAREVFSTRTASSGQFEIGGFPANGMALLGARAPGQILRQQAATRFGPDAMHRPGQQNIKLVLEEAGAVEGRVVIEETGEGLAGVHLHLNPDQPHLALEPVLSGPDGAFRIEAGGRNYVLSAVFGASTPPEWVAKRESFSVEPGQTTRDVLVKAVRGGVLEVTVLDEEEKAVAGASIYAMSASEGHHMNVNSSSAGLGVMRLLPGSYQAGAHRANQRAEQVSATVEDGATNKVTIRFKPRPKIVGTVTDPDGKPAPGLRLFTFPNWGMPDAQPTTDADGKYEMPWEPQRYGGEQDFILVASDPDRNLAATEDIDEETRTLDLRLEPGLAMTGRVEDADNRPLTNASIRVIMWSARMGSDFGVQPKTDSEGNFKIAGLPVGRRYQVSASAEGYGSVSAQVQESEDETAVELPVFALRVADRDVAGQVVDEEEKPVAGVYVSTYGDGQPNTNMRTDNEGRFAIKVCEGTVRLHASHQNTYSSATAEAGDTNVVLQLRSYSSSREREQPKRASLKNRPLPDLAPLGLSKDADTEPGPMLLCLFDSEQRPSRRFLSMLDEHHGELRNKKVVVMAAQAVLIPSESLQEWRDGNSYSFPVGAIAEKAEAVKWVTAVDKLPWLILADAQGQVVAEGFEWDELDEQIGLLQER
jgi:hypothetical protein